MQSVLIREATHDDSDIIANFIYQLLLEQFPNDTTYTPDNLRGPAKHVLIHAKNYWVFMAVADNQPVGMLALNECTAIYAFGNFGEITELYVMPAYRSHGIGTILTEKAYAFGKVRAWSMIEVATADVPRWQRTVDFYKRVGFKEIGPRLYHVL